MNKFELRRQNSLERAKNQIHNKQGILHKIEKKEEKVYLYVECKRHHKWWTTVYKLNETASDWCKECYHFEKAAETRERTYIETVEYLKLCNSHLLEKSYDYEKQHLHVFCEKHNGEWNKLGYEATRIKREKLTCPVCKNIEKELLKQRKIEQQIEEQKQRKILRERDRENIRIEKIKQKEQLKLIQELEKKQKSYVPPLPKDVDSFDFYSEYERIYNVCEGRQPVTLARAREKLINNNCKNITAISTMDIHYFCNCGKEYTKTKKQIMQNTFSVCSICGHRIALKKAHATRMKHEYEEMCYAAKLQHITILKDDRKTAEDKVTCIASNGKQFYITYRQFKMRRGILNPDVSRGGTSIPEILCREIIEQLTGKKFPKGFPEGWTYSTKNNRTRTFSVDMYNCKDFDIPIAIEYWGQEIHVKAKESSSIHTKERVQKTQENDKRKAAYAKETNTKLIIIQGYDNYVPLNKMIEEIKKILYVNNIPYDQYAKVELTSNLFSFDDYYSKVQKICNQHSPATGIVLTTFIPKVDTPIEVLCNLHNIKFNTRPIKMIYRNSWNCSECKRIAARERNLLTRNDIENKLSYIPYPYKITFIEYIESPSSHALAKWNCSEHGDFKKRMDSVLYKNYEKYHACPRCENIMYPKN